LEARTPFLKKADLKNIVLSPVLSQIARKCSKLVASAQQTVSWAKLSLNSFMEHKKPIKSAKLCVEAKKESVPQFLPLHILTKTDERALSIMLSGLVVHVWKIEKL
jgi:hypothetical protein